MNFKIYRNKLTSSIRTSKAIYFSEAIKSGNNVGELWKHLKDITSVSKCHIKCIDIDGKNVIILKIFVIILITIFRQWLNASSKIPTWMRPLKNLIIGLVPSFGSKIHFHILVNYQKKYLGTDHLTCRGGYGYFLKQYSDSQCCWKKYSDFGGGKKQ